MRALLASALRSLAVLVLVGGLVWFVNEWLKSHSFADEEADAATALRERGMTRLWLALLAALMSWPSIVSAHEVPDRVQIGVFLKPEKGRMLILVRMPANALIDFLLPTLRAATGWTWRTPMVPAPKVLESGSPTCCRSTKTAPRCHGLSVLAVRLSRVNDPSFATFEGALNRVNGPPLPATPSSSRIR